MSESNLTFVSSGLFITNNGDGGVKHVDVMTNEVTITVEDNE